MIASLNRTVCLKRFDDKEISNVIAWRRLKGRRNPEGVLTLKNRIDVEGPGHLRIVYKGLRASLGA